MTHRAAAIRAIDQRLARTVRRLSASLRLLPDFIIIGAQRCGTTSLYAYLCSHPAVVPAAKKEIHFFDGACKDNPQVYRSYFPTRLYKSYRQLVRRQTTVTGEASPYYLFHPLAPYNASRMLPRVKLIVLLRNPIERAYSHYWHEVRTGYESLSFEQAIECEGERLKGERERTILHKGAYRSVAHQRFSYLARGIYADQIEVWQRLFHKEQMLILRSETFYAEPAATLGRVADSLGLSPHTFKADIVYQQGNYPEMATSTRKDLEEYFLPHNARLFALLGRDLEWGSGADTA